MRRGICSAALGMVFIVAAAAMPADAASGKSQNQEVSAQRATVAARKRGPARITVRRRSFTDAGTEVLPGERKFMDYAMPPGYSVTQTIDNTNAYHRYPLPGPFDLPSRRNPWLSQ